MTFKEGSQARPRADARHRGKPRPLSRKLSRARRGHAAASGDGDRRRNPQRRLRAARVPARRARFHRRARHVVVNCDGAHCSLRLAKRIARPCATPRACAPRVNLVRAYSRYLRGREGAESGANLGARCSLHRYAGKPCNDEWRPIQPLPSGLRPKRPWAALRSLAGHQVRLRFAPCPWPFDSQRAPRK